MVPINALVTRAPCPACQRPVEVSIERWQRLLANIVPPDAPPGKTGSVALMGDPIKLDSVREDPRCARCQTAIPDEAAGFAARGFTMCPGCGARLGVRPPPESLAPVLRGASLICGEDLDQVAQKPGAAAPKSAHPIELRCATCSGPLHVDGTQRNVHCEYCGSDMFLPDDVWLRLHPISEVRPFYVCWASQGAVATAALREFRWDQMRDAVAGPDGKLYVVGVDHATDRMALWCMGLDLALTWKHDDVPVSDSKTRLALDGRRILLWQPGKHSAVAYAMQDGAALGSVGGEEPAGATVHHMDLDRASALCCDPDGTLLAQIGYNLVRFAGDGTGVETWLPRPGMFSVKHEKLAPLYSPQRSLRRPDYSHIEKLPDRPTSLPESTLLAIARDSSVFMMDGNAIARLDRHGHVLFRHTLQISGVASRRMVLDAAGNAYAICTRPGTYPYEYVLLKISPDGARVDTLATDHAHGGPLGAADDVTLAVTPDGTCVVLSYDGIARVIGPDGTPRYISPAAKDEDERDRKKREARS